MGLLSFFSKNTDSKPKITLYFVDGSLQNVIPKETQNFYDCDFIYSDGIKYDMSKVESIKNIRVPNFKTVDSFNKYGATGSLDYIIRMKAGKYFEQNKKELCSACLWKSSELMFENKGFIWRKPDFERLIKWHLQLEMTEEAEKAMAYLRSKGLFISDNYKAKKSNENSEKLIRSSNEYSNLKSDEKELLIVQNTTTEDMRSLTSMPFVWNSEVKKFIRKGGHPFAYMDIFGENIEIVKSELNKINTIIKSEIKNHPEIPKNAIIPLDKLIYKETELSGCTRIMCTPKTLKGNKTKYPLSIFFIDNGNLTHNSTHGEITYGQDGKIKKGKVYCWRNGKNYFYYFETVDDELKLVDFE